MAKLAPHLGVPVLVNEPLSNLLNHSVPVRPMKIKNLSRQLVQMPKLGSFLVYDDVATQEVLHALHPHQNSSRSFQCDQLRWPT